MAGQLQLVFVFSFLFFFCSENALRNCSVLGEKGDSGTQYGRISQGKNHALVIVRTLGSGVAESRAWGGWQSYSQSYEAVEGGR